MNRWQQVEKLCQAALELEESQRVAFLEDACAGDEELRREVESLLRFDSRGDRFIEEPALEVAAKMVAQEPQSLIGQQLGSYQILSLLGAGGMGVVYKARDTKLDRTVALKILSAEVASDRDRMRRFVREAKAASAISHPNVAHIYDIGDSGGASFIAMEHVEGQTLAAKIDSRRRALSPSGRRAGGEGQQRRPLETAEILDIGIQVADALDEAHSQRVIHRDIKPANIMLTPRGQVKVLDFGIAKVTRPEAQTEASDISTLVSTASGLLMGTVEYMSPEQVLGHEIDHRTDIFSLGVVLYQMATGHRPFSGSTAGETMDLILHAQPEAIAHFTPNRPAELERIIHKALEKDRDRRYQSARDLLIDLKNLKRDGDRGIASTVGSAPKAASMRALMSRWRYWAASLVGAAVLVGLVVNGWRERLPRRSASEQVKSLAVLPIENLSRDPDQEYFADGMTDELIGTLAKVSSMRVISRTSVMRYKGMRRTVREIARELNVDIVVEGTVMRSGDRVRITARLVDTAMDQHLWAESYERGLGDVLALQADVAQAIARQIQIKVKPQEQARLASVRQVNPEAYEAYLKGQYYWNKLSFTEEGLQKTTENFERAIEKDRGYAQAYAALAKCTWPGGYFGYLAPEEAYPRVKALASKALELDESLAEAHTALAAVKLYFDWDWAGAEIEFRRAIELNPNDAENHRLYGYYLAAMSRLDESRVEFSRAYELEPVSLPINTALAHGFYFSHQYDLAVKQLRKSLELDPNYAFALYSLAKVSLEKSMFEEAISEAQTAVTSSKGSPAYIALLGHAYAASGNRVEAVKILHELQELSRKRHVRPSDLAVICVGLGDKDQALRWYEQAYQERDSYLVWLKQDPLLKGMRSGPRFQHLMRRIGLTP